MLRDQGVLWIVVADMGKRSPGSQEEEVERLSTLPSVHRYEKVTTSLSLGYHN